MRDGGYHVDGGHPSLVKVIKSAQRRMESVMYIMLDPKTDRFHEIRPCGFEHWSKTYKLVATVTMVPTVKFTNEEG